MKAGDIRLFYVLSFPVKKRCKTFLCQNATTAKDPEELLAFCHVLYQLPLVVLTSGTVELLSKPSENRSYQGKESVVVIIATITK